MLEGNGLIQACNQIAFRSRYLIAIFRYDCYCYFCTSKTVRNINAFCVLNRFSHVWLFATLGTVACQTPLSMGFPRQEYWSWLPFPSPEFRHLISNYKCDLWWWELRKEGIKSSWKVIEDLSGEETSKLKLERGKWGVGHKEMKRKVFLYIEYSKL